MPDSRLQQFERAWRASGAAEDAAALLRERVRIGELTPKHLQLAGNCGHAGAALAVGGAPHADERDVGRWVYGLRSWARRGEWPPGARHLFRLATHAAAECLLEALAENDLEHPGPARAVARLERWVEEGVPIDPNELTELYADLSAAEDLAVPKLAPFPRHRAKRCLQALRVCLGAVISPAPPNATAASAARHAVKLVDAERVRAAIATKVLDWILGPARA